MMTVKKANKKLELKKEKLANLSFVDMKTAQGGINDTRSIRITGCNCPTGTAPGACY